MAPCDGLTHGPSNGPGKGPEIQALLHCAVTVYSCVSYLVLWVPVTMCLEAIVWSLYFFFLLWVRNWSSYFTQSQIKYHWPVSYSDLQLDSLSCLCLKNRAMHSPCKGSRNSRLSCDTSSSVSPNLNSFHSSWSLNRSLIWLLEPEEISGWNECAFSQLDWIFVFVWQWEPMITHRDIKD